MKTSTYFLLIVLLLCAGANMGYAQAPWSRTYPSPGRDNLQGLHYLRSGGYLLSGTEGNKIFLVRTTDQGDAIWTKAQRIPRFSSLWATHSSEDDQGHVLVVGNGNSTNSTTGEMGAFMVMFDRATGDTLWSKTLTGPSTPYFADLAWTPALDYALTANIGGRPYLVRMSTTGQITQQTPVDYVPSQPGGVTRLARGTGGYWVAVNSTAITHEEGTIKVVFVSDAGVRGAEYVTPVRVGYDNYLPNKGVRSFLPVEEGNFLLAGGFGGTVKLSPTFTTLWTRKDFLFPPTRPQNAGSLVQVVRTTGGNYLYVLVAIRDSHYIQVNLFLFSPDNTQLRSGSGYFSQLDTGSPAEARVTVNPVNGQFVLATSVSTNNYQMDGTAGDVVLAAVPRVATPATQLYPNPIEGAEPVTITAPVPLTGPYILADMQGRTVRSGRMQPTAPGRYELALPSLPAGLYQLRLTDTRGQLTTLKVMKQ